MYEVAMMIKGQLGEVLELRVLRRQYENAQNDYDANWLEAEVFIKIPSFNAHYRTYLCSDDFQRFYDDIIYLRNRGINEAEFATMEEGLRLNLKLQKTGSLFCTGKADDHSGNSLVFHFVVDNMALDYLIDQLKILLHKYPVITSLK